MHSEVSSEHFIREPATKEADYIGIDTGIPEFHCAGGTERTGADFRVMEADRRTQSTKGSF